MSDCCAPGSGFPNASLMEQIATNNSVVWEEICLIQQAILSASSLCSPSGGQMCTTVGGNTPMTFITGVNSVTVVNGGNGYFQDTPAIKFVPPVGVTPTSIATGTVNTNGGSIMSITITNGGLGYQPVPATLAVSSGTGSGAALEPLVNTQGNILGVNISTPGVNYITGDTVIATRAVLPNLAYVDAVFQITAVGLLGEILSVAVLNPGSGYQNSVTEISITSTLNPLLPFPTGSGFLGVVSTDVLGTISNVVVSSTGAGYTNYPPYLVITDQGTGATTNVTLSGTTSIASIAVVESGTEYTVGATGVVFNPPTAALPNPPSTPAVVTINTNVNTYGTTPNAYWNVWSNTVANKPIQMQLNAVLSYFRGLGYIIQIQSNPDTGSTIQWKICW